MGFQTSTGHKHGQWWVWISLPLSFKMSQITAKMVKYWVSYDQNCNLGMFWPQLSQFFTILTVFWFVLMGKPPAYIPFIQLYLDIKVNLDELQGASKIIGRFYSWWQWVVLEVFEEGIANGNAVGSIYDWGDMTMAEPPALHQIGSVFLYFSNENPSAIIPTHSQPTMKVSLDVVHSSKPIFEALAKKYANVTSKSELQSIKLKPIGFTSRVAYVKFPIRQCDIILDLWTGSWHVTIFFWLIYGWDMQRYQTCKTVDIYHFPSLPGLEKNQTCSMVLKKSLRKKFWILRWGTELQTEKYTVFCLV